MISSLLMSEEYDRILIDYVRAQSARAPKS
jgi:hypothetical protein